MVLTSQDSLLLSFDPRYSNIMGSRLWVGHTVQLVEPSWTPCGWSALAPPGPFVVRDFLAKGFSVYRFLSQLQTVCNPRVLKTQV